MKKKIIKIIMILFLIFIIFRIFLVLISNNRLTNSKVYSYYNYSDTIILKSNTSVDTITYENISIRNDFKDFSINDIDSNTLSYKLTEPYIAYFNMGKRTDEFDTLKIDKLNKYLVKNKLYNTNDVLEFMYNNKNNIFTTINEVRIKSSIGVVYELTMPTCTDIYKVIGNYRGHLCKINSGTYELLLFKNNYIYYFDFISKEYFTLDSVLDIIKTIKID